MMKKLFSIVAMLALALTIVGCGKDEKIVVGILQPLEHEALNQAKLGFEQGLVDAGFDDTKVEVVYNNALGSDNDLKSMASSLIRKADLTLGIGTGAAQALISASDTVNSSNPILFTAVTDPVKSGIVTSEVKPGGKVTGSSDMNPVEDQINLIKDFIPSAKTLGICYTASETNSEVQANMAKAQAESMGLNVEVMTVAQASDIQMTIRNLASKADVIYIPTDNLLASNMPLIAQVCNETKTFTICGEEGPVDKGGAASLSISYFELGRRTGEMAAKILNGTNAGDLDVIHMSASECKVVYNTETLATLGIELPENLK